MARINIDDSLYTDSRFVKLVLLLKDYDRAIGSIVRAWTVAQKHFVTPEKMIPLDAWKRQDLRDEIIEVGLAERVGDFVRICGAEEQFAWITQRINAGRKGGIAGRQTHLPAEERAKREAARIVIARGVKSGKIIKPEFCEDCGKADEIQAHHSDYSQPLMVNWICKSCHNKTHADLRTVDNHPQATAKRPLEPVKPQSLSPSLSPSLSQSPTQAQEEEFNTLRFEEEKPAPPRSPKALAPSKTKFFIARYCENWKLKHGSSPEIVGKDAGIAARLSKNMSEDRISQLVAAYFAMPDAFLFQARHPLELFERDLKKISAFANSGAFMTRKQTQQHDDMASNMMLLAKVRKGEA